MPEDKAKVAKKKSRNSTISQTRGGKKSQLRRDAEGAVLSQLSSDAVEKVGMFSYQTLESQKKKTEKIRESTEKSED